MCIKKIYFKVCFISTMFIFYIFSTTTMLPTNIEISTKSGIDNFISPTIALADPNRLENGSETNSQDGWWKPDNEINRSIFYEDGNKFNYNKDQAASNNDKINTASAEKVKTPVFSIESGTYNMDQLISINCATNNSLIKYTTDGSTPSLANGTAYKSTIIISSTVTLKAIAIKRGMEDSDVESATYIINISPPGQTLTLDFGGINLEMIKIPAGRFRMGSPSTEPNRSSDEGPVHTVIISKDFYIGKYEVTQGQWKAIMNTNPSCFKYDDNYPVEQVSWNDITEPDYGFLARLNARNLCQAPFRLPTEAEWEYACRANTTTPYYWGTSLNENFCWYNGNSGKATHQVGTKLPNAWGLYDMSGNVWEWCSDWHGAYSANSVTDPEGYSKGPYRILRGGSWYLDNFDDVTRSANRGIGSPTSKGSYVGFRLVLATP